MNHLLIKRLLALGKDSGSRIFLMILILSSMSVAGQTTWYVNDAVTTGDIYTTAAGSAAGTGTAASPFLTLSAGINAASNGDTIYVILDLIAEMLHALIETS